MSFLLDVNVLIALIDHDHVDHNRAHAWFAAMGSAWATCPLTENGVLRIVGRTGYSLLNRTPADILELMAAFCSEPGHSFWPDSVSFRDARRVDSTKLLYSTRLTDTYLLALAVANGGQLATFDRRIATDAVAGGAQALYLIP